MIQSNSNKFQKQESVLEETAGKEGVLVYTTFYVVTETACRGQKPHSIVNVPPSSSQLLVDDAFSVWGHFLFLHHQIPLLPLEVFSSERQEKVSSRFTYTRKV